ncbi:ABC transporter permease [Microbacterium sp. MYb54]|nr:ABC transporter permease [Microbacterium sp. MYb43]PQZ76813.1 ABC transporter permease [Microbacterium sp. MYb40]PRB21206.1 ABC transporter permease [Microbacterium sp. MYb54]PRB25064.1 ABC transporter permease [Microbacterium sp. MYb50]PRB67027.1 ABC transporter permease [Microbacterium sp. MYb24]PRB74505.1 ABC transporter permease [Microbacterium sp. MYb32]
MSNELVLASIILVLVIVMCAVNPAFFSVHTLFSILRSALVPMVFALAVLFVIISGGIDVSFAAIGIFAAYTTVSLAQGGSLDFGLIGILAFAIVIGGALGFVNGIVIARFRLPTLIVTLATQGIFKGVLLAYIGSKYIAELPDGISWLSTANLISIESTRAYLPMLIVPVVLLVIGAAFVLRRTMFGRGIYAMGGDLEGARRAGFPVVRLQVMLYVLVGAVAAIGGLIHVVLGRSANPQDLVGTELDVIAAVVLGGASIFGGRGTVTGTVLGVLLVQIINNSLILMGVPTAWQRAAVGFLLVIGVGIQAVMARRASRRTFVLDTVKE